jgi:hypothetical protein
VRSELKKFCILPPGTENEIIETIFGDIGIMMEEIATQSNTKLILKENGATVNAKRGINFIPKAKVEIPPKLNKLIRRIYSFKACPIHKDKHICKKHLA